MKNRWLPSCWVLLLLPVVFLLIGLFTLNDYGETTDEKSDQQIGAFYYYDWPKVGYAGLMERMPQLLRNYGPAFDFVAVASFDLLHKHTGWIKNEVASFHLPVLWVSTGLVLLVGGLAARQWGLMYGLFAQLCLALMPRFIGESQNNLKDTPLSLGFALSVVGGYLAIQTGKFRWMLAAGIALGITYAIKVNALIVLPILFGWWLTVAFATQTLSWRKLAGLIYTLSVIVLIAMLTVMAVWPYYRVSFFDHLLETMATFKEHSWNMSVLYLGQFFTGKSLPTHYPFVMLAVTTPLVLLGLATLGGVRSVWLLLTDRLRHHEFTLLLVIWALAVPFVQVISGAPMYDGVRHYLASLPPMVLLTVYGFRWLWDSRPKWRWLTMSLVAVQFVYLLILNWQLHPYQIVYFNQLTGGIAGARDRFDLEYWGSSLKETAEWVNHNLPTGSRIWLVVGMGHHFYVDRSRFSLVGPTDQPDYKITLVRGMAKDADPGFDYLHPPTSPIHSILVNGTSILDIYQVASSSADAFKI